MINASENLSAVDSTVKPWGQGENLTGLVFNRLTILRYADRDRFKNSRWLCKCSCGTELIINGGSVKNGHTRSCGCLQRESTGNVRRTHGCNGTKGKTPEYNSWVQMKQRCLNPKYTDYHNYGGRGIKICERWMEFGNFLSDMGSRPKGTSLDRKKNNENYEPGNCQWATRIEQNNNRRDNHVIEYKGKTLNLAQWAREIGISEHVLSVRINRYGWTTNRALSTPVQKNKRTCTLKS